MYNLTAQISSQLDKFAEILAVNKEDSKVEIKKKKMNNNLEPDKDKPLETNEVIEEEIVDLPDFDDDLD